MTEARDELVIFLAGIYHEEVKLSAELGHALRTEYIRNAELSKELARSREEIEELKKKYAAAKRGMVFYYNQLAATLGASKRSRASSGGEPDEPARKK
jgi:predicted  nucleic acid-binding Zn-ribbon protein